METGVDQSFPVVRPGTVRRNVRGPVSPSRASGRTIALSARRPRLNLYGLGERVMSQVKRAATPRPPRGGLGALGPAMTQIQWANGRMWIVRMISPKPSASRSPIPRPTPICGHSMSLPDVVTETGTVPRGRSVRSNESR